MAIRKSKSPKETIDILRKVVQGLSLKYIETLADTGEDDPDQLKHLNRMKRNLAFAEKLYKEMNPPVKGVKNNDGVLSSNILKKIKKLESSVGDIIRQMPKN